MRLPVYLDHHATTPVDPRVLTRMLPYFTETYGNPSSQDHAYGAEALEAVEHAREQVAAVIKAKPEEIAFTSGATEADNMAIFGVANTLRSRGNHVITAATEHKAVLDPCRRLREQGFRVTILPVDESGRVHTEVLRSALTSETILVSLMAANNEVGTLSELDELARACNEQGVYFHTDAAQAFGQVPLNISKTGIDLLSLSGHKIYGPKGVGALFVRRRGRLVKLAPLVSGGGQERGLRSGTLNVPGIVGLGEAARIADAERDAYTHRMKVLSARFLKGLQDRLGSVHVNGDLERRLGHNLSLRIDGVNNKAMIQALRGLVAISGGSACTTNSVEPSHVLLALGLSREQAMETVRIGLGRFTTDEEVDFAVGRIADAALRVRRVPSPSTRSPIGS